MTGANMAEKNVLIVVPIYQQELSEIERLSLTYSLAKLPSRDVVFVGPQGLPMDYYAFHFPGIALRCFDAAYFKSVATYSHLLLRPDFYSSFQEYEFILILQTDAIVLRDDLNHWVNQSFDYVGAPWPGGWKLKINVARFAGENEKLISVDVGNGGLSLRRISGVLSLLNHFSDVAAVAIDRKMAEDMFYGISGVLADGFRVPDALTASRFAMEFDPQDMFVLNGAVYPMGGHSWWEKDPQFWLPLIDETFRDQFQKLIPVPTQNTSRNT